MLFNSLLFLVFFVIVTSAYYLLPHKYRWMLLLAASCYFYMYFKMEYILIILFTIVVDYCAGILIGEAGKKNKKAYLLISLAANIGVLAFYKYFNFFTQNINSLSGLFHVSPIPLMNIILPIGLSFHTFQAMSYTIEVYRGNQKAERHFGLYALYVLFYPQMVAGPIERPQHILPQLRKHVRFSAATFTSGLFLMMIGFFKKVVIADRLGLYVDPIFSNPHGHSPLELLLATYFFSFQIYCDFSGYSDIAIGAALTLGIELMKNFNMPYLSQDIAEFWKRWHISLSTWFRDYVYIPLGGSRVSFAVTCGNILVVFLISGLWHGANWKFLAWGLIHGGLLILYQLFKKLNLKINWPGYLKWLLTFNVVCLAWIFFRAETMSDAVYILGRIFSFSNFFYAATNLMAMNEIYYCVFLLLFLVSGEWLLRKSGSYTISGKLWGALAIGIACYFFGVFNEAQFIYFQF